MPDSPPEEEEQQRLQACTEFVLDAAFRQTIQEITANLTRVTDEKLGPLSQIEERTAEAENRIAAAGRTRRGLVGSKNKYEAWLSMLTTSRIEAGEKKMSGLLVYQKTKFFESRIPDLPGMETKAGRVKTERAHHTLAPKPGLNQRPRPSAGVTEGAGAGEGKPESRNACGTWVPNTCRSTQLH